MTTTTSSELTIDLTTDSPSADRAGSALPPLTPPSQPPTRTRRRRSSVRRWGARLLVLLMLAGAVAGGVRLTEVRTQQKELLALETVTLTAAPIPVEPTHEGLVTATRVHSQERVVVGQVLGSILTTTTTPAGKVKHATESLRAPVDGVVVAEPVPVGSTVRPGQSFVGLYAPEDLTLVADVPLWQLSKLAPGMTAELHTAGLPQTVVATIAQSVPRVGTDPSLGPDRLHLVLVPKNPALTAQLVPGLTFSGTVDTSSGRAGSKGSIFVAP